MTSGFDSQHIERALALLNDVLAVEQSPSISLVVCGGAALSLMGFYQRTTKDVDVVALYDPNRSQFLSPSPLPSPLVHAAGIVASELDMPFDWLNNGPSRDHGGLFQLGLPKGMSERLTKRRIGEKLTIYLISRLDQIHFKFYAAIDQPGSYHTMDLRVLKPTDDELEMALRWATTHDVSAEFLGAALDFLRDLGHGDVASRF